MNTITALRADKSAEQKTRVDLAAFYRLGAHYGWDDLIYNHISARIPGEPDTYLVNEFGLLFEEITASNLLKVHLDGRVLNARPGAQGYNIAVPSLHALILQHRPDVTCVAHVHTPEGMALAAHADGLLPLSQTAMGLITHIAYHDYDHIFAPGEAERLIADLGAKNILVLRNHGLVALGTTIPETFLNLYNLIYAAKAQVATLAAGDRVLSPPSHVVNASAPADDEAWANRKGGPRDPDGCLEWQAALRMLDRRGASYRD